MSVRFARSGSNIIKDHRELINKGKRTHEELDYIVDEVEEARGGFASLNDRLLDIISRIGTGGGGGGSCTDINTYLYYVYECKENGVFNVRLKEGSFKAGSGELEVFRGGLKQTIGKDYVEIDDKEIKFIDPLWAGEVVVLRVRDRFGLINSLGFHSEYFIVNEENIREFTINYKFDKEGKRLEVYLNGILQNPGLDFIILSTNTILFVNPVPLGSLVYFRIADKNLNEDPILIQEKFVAEKNKVKYNLSKFNYQPGKEELEIYVMGMRCIPGVDYKETSPTSFVFLKEIQEGSIILACKENAGYPKSSHYHCYGIIPIGEVNGKNREFYLQHIPQKGSVLLYVGGIRQGLDTYKIEKNKIILAFPPPKGIDMFVDYVI